MFPEKEHPILRAAQGAPEPNDPYLKFLSACKNFCEKQLSPGSAVTKYMTKVHAEVLQEVQMRMNFPDQKKDPQDFYRMILTSILTLVLLILFFVLPGNLIKIDQLRNDLKEQDQVIEVEQKNNDFLQRLEEDNNTLQKNMARVEEAVPNRDERAENMIANLEVISNDLGFVIQSIGINKLSDSQFYNDDLIGVVDPYEYSFSIKGDYYQLVTLLRYLRESLRIMDVMALGIEQDKTSGLFQMNLSLLAYHLAK